MSENLSNIRDAATKLGEAQAADILLFNGEIVRNVEHKFIGTVLRRKRRPNVILVLVTPGGDYDAAYRIGRCLQRHYETVTLFITGRCKGAGTLVATAANRLVFSEFGELGPLDVQLSKLGHAPECGLQEDVNAALKQLARSSRVVLEEVTQAIEQAGGGRLAFKASAELSCDLVGRLFGNIFSQIDPIRIGDALRTATVAREYGERLVGGSWNLQATDGLELLISSHSYHAFVIDFEEAQGIFKNVMEAKEDFASLLEALGDVGLLPISFAEQGDVMLAYLNKEFGEASREATNLSEGGGDEDIRIHESS